MMKSLPYFAFLILVAVMIYWKLHIIALLVLALWAFFRLWWFCADRWPRTTTTTITWLILGMLSGGRRRW